MSLRINHNIAALNAHRNLQNTTEALQSSMQRLSSGFRINRGADDPAGLVISEQFRAQIAGLNRAIGNSEGSISMIQTAEGALTEINSLLVSMRELAIHAANEGFNDADQLAADQAEIQNAIKTIDRIAANTQFGTKKLLDGSKENVAMITTQDATSMASVLSSGLKTGTHYLHSVKTADSAASLNSSNLGVSLANTDGDPYNLSEGVHKIDVVQSSDVATKASGNVGITDAWGNGLEIAAAAATATLKSAVAFSSGNVGNAGSYNFFIRYQDQETNNGNPSALQTLTVAMTAGTTGAEVSTLLNNAIAANSELAGKIQAVASIQAGHATANSVWYSFETVNEGAQFSVKTDASSTSAVYANALSFADASDRGASLGALSFTTNTDQQNLLTNEAITVANAVYTDMDTLVAAINTGIAGATYASSTSDITAAKVDANHFHVTTVDEGSTYYLQVNQTAGATSDLSRALGLSVDAQANTGVDALVNFDNYSNAINDVKASATGTFTLKTGPDSDPANQGTMSIITAQAKAATNGTGILAGNVLATVTATKFNVQLDGGTKTAATAGQDVTVYNADRSEWMTVRYGLTSTGGNATISNTDQSLVFQIGANVGQTASISLRNIAASSLGRNITGNMFSDLAEIDVTSVQGSQDAQSIIDAAINEVSTTRGTLGSFQKNTLESNLRNLRIAAQNLTASESQIRDTDMAKEMSEFTKNQILVQAGTAILAQANQTPQMVLSLF